MNYTACIQPMKTYLKVTVNGTMESFEDMADFADLLRKLSEEYDLNWALLDQRKLRRNLDVLDIYTLAEDDITAKAAARGVRVACLPSPEDREFAESMETILHNRSVSYRVFSDPNDAVAWLTR
ncbi:hypothetical protein [uncultured Pseudodesulfovibrio sp.]|uniref:hypothetical protein n=1 Tax=uncultured Pseudodesulfovibrio sp. TaxID=2035858 RepID=UPI0029C677E7|nr:hypothetical protein [uncultured Pseudodesulfovibrio sp.]